MKTRTERILTVMHIVMWIIFIGTCIQAGAIIISYFVSLYNPIAAKDLYLGLNFFDLRQHDMDQYQITIFFVVATYCLKAYMAYLTIKIFLTINFSQPFSIEVAKLIQKISQAALIAGLIAIVADGYSQWLIKNGVTIKYNWPSGEFLLAAGVIFVIAQVFKKGIELQAENELTV